MDFGYVSVGSSIVINVSLRSKRDSLEKRERERKRDHVLKTKVKKKISLPISLRIYK